MQVQARRQPARAGADDRDVEHAGARRSERGPLREVARDVSIHGAAELAAFLTSGLPGPRR